MSHWSQHWILWTQRMFLCHRRMVLSGIVNLNRMIPAARCLLNQTRQRRVEMTHSRCQPPMISRIESLVRDVIEKRILRNRLAPFPK
jgi:hypothetical protein